MRSQTDYSARCTSALAEAVFSVVLQVGYFENAVSLLCELASAPGIIDHYGTAPLDLMIGLSR